MLISWFWSCNAFMLKTLAVGEDGWEIPKNDYLCNFYLKLSLQMVQNKVLKKKKASNSDCYQQTNN